jgi:hypothetical protein
VYPQSTILRWRRLLRENLPSEIVRLGQSVSLRQALQPVIEVLQQTTSPADVVDIFKGMAEICSWPAPEETTKLGDPPSSVHGSSWSGASLEDDLVQESVGASKAADGHSDNGE